MSELIVRLTALDDTLLPTLAAGGSAIRAARVVIDAHAAAKTDSFATETRRLGLPLLIDPSTFLLQDQQPANDSWARLSFATRDLVTVADLMNVARADELVAEVIEFQLGHGASAVFAPYVHIENSNDGWADVQALLYRRTRRYVDQRPVALPVIAPIALSWSLLGRTKWAAVLDRLIRALGTLEPQEVVLAASKVHLGVHTDHRLADLLAATQYLSRSYPVIAWRQGMFGEACVVAGAAGYETGIGWGEKCDLRDRMAQRRKPSSGGGGRPVYIDRLGMSLPRRTIQALMADQSVSALLAHLDVACCPMGKRGLLDDARAHAVTARATTLKQVAAAGHPRWAWQLLADRANQGLELAHRINLLTERGLSPTHVDTAALQAIATTAAARRQTANRHHAA